MLTIAIAELKMLLRNRLVALCALIIPLVIGVMFMLNDIRGSEASIASIQLMAMAGLGVYVTATTTLAGRRQTLFLKRLRSAAIPDRSILTGLVLPIVLVNVVQIGVILAVLVSRGEAAPTQPLLLVAALLVTEAMFVGFALATAGVTNSPEHAQFTTLPVFFATFGVAMWAGFTGFADLGWLKRALPGGGSVDLINAAWSGELGGVLPSMIAMLAWAVVAALAARAMFRWEPRA